MADEFRESDLCKLLAFIRGEGDYKRLGRGFITCSDDQDGGRKYAICCELERRELVWRSWSDGRSIEWMPTGRAARATEEAAVKQELDAWHRSPVIGCGNPRQSNAGAADDAAPA